MSLDFPASVPLPRTNANGSTKGKPPVWPIDDSGPTVETPLPAKCARHTREGEICCQELKGEDERQLVDPDVVRDVVIGLSDGLTVPFALAAGLSSLGESRLVVLGGIAELIAGAISMGIGGFLASQAERDHYRYLRRTTKARVQRSCDGEVEREVHAILGPVGVEQNVSRQVALHLLEVESGGERSDGAPDAERGLKWSQSVGVTEFLLKLGEGLEDVPTRRLYLSAFTIGTGYLVGGMIPLLPYLFIPTAHIALIYSSIFTGIVLLIFGAVKARVTGAAGRGFGGYIWGAVTTLAVGGAAAGAAFGIVALLEKL
ncbi:VIT family-domain-containing protein [Russula dissimulans]|nr:VIT family-domain-containing protein [Russula dissimulans]